MNPYAPPNAPRSISTENVATPRLLAAEGHVRGIGLVCICFALAGVLGAARAHGLRQGVSLAFFVVYLAAGVEMLRMRERARGFAMGAAAFSVLDSVGVLGSRGQQSVSVALTVAMCAWALWYVCVGGGARVLAPSYSELRASHPEPPPRIAVWAKIVAGLLALGGLGSIALDLLRLFRV